MNHILHTLLVLTILFTANLRVYAYEQIPFRFEGNLLLIKANLNGETGEFILDTGAPDLIVNQAHFLGMQIPWVQKEVIDFHGQSSEARHFSITEFAIGDQIIKKKNALSIDLSSIERLKGIHLFGIIGYSVLKEFEIILDFDREVLILSPEQKKATIFLNQEAPIASFNFRYSGHIPYLVAHIGKKKLRLGLDTGSEVNILSDKTAKRVEAMFDEVKKIRVKGINCHSRAAATGSLQQLMIDDRHIGPLDMTVISIHSLNESLTIDLDGILGIPFLRRGRIGINYKKRKLYMWPSAGRLVNAEIARDLEVSIDKKED